MKHILETNWPSWVLILVSLGIGITMSGRLPEQIPVHFDVSGNADGYASKALALTLFPSVAFLVVLLVMSLLKLAIRTQLMLECR